MMKQIFTALFLLRTSLSFATSIDQVLAKYPALNSGGVGIEILDAATGSTVYSKNGQTPLNPASSLKIIVSAASFSELGLGYTFKTTVKSYDRGLCLVGGGDPSLVQESLKELAEISARLLKPSAANAVRELIVDESLFPAEKPFDLTFAGDEDRAFTADIGALSVNFNSIAIRAQPTELGMAANVTVSPEIAEITVVNATTTSSTGGKKDIGVSITPKVGNKGYTVKVFGKVSAKEDVFTLYASIPSEPALYAGYIFKRSLEEKGIHIQNVTKGVCPKNARTVMGWPSKPLANIVQDMNIYSNNFIAEMLLRNIGSGHDKTSGLAKVNQWMTANNLLTPKTVIENASGLSRNNRISAHTLASVFYTAMNDLEFGPEFLTSMSINGRTGTMRNRLKTEAVSGSANPTIVRAKSGTLKGVVSLVGRAKSYKRDYIFAFLFNEANYPAGELQSLENQVIQSLLEIR